jgi:acetyltransferase-like isoleucine patch superfamily enzyme
MEPAATVHDHVMIGFGALITRDVSIGPASYVCAGAIVSRDVPPQHIAYGVNELCPAGDWRGPLNTSALFHVKGPA